MIFFDIETYSNLFCFCWRDDKGNVGVIRDEQGVIGQEQLDAIDKILTSDYTVSFNGTKFDLPVLAQMRLDILKLGTTTTSYVASDAQSLISYDANHNPVQRFHKQYEPWSSRHFDEFNCNLIAKSLKQWELYNNLKVRELPYSFNKHLTSEEQDEVIDYCHYDTYAVSYLFYNQKGQGGNTGAEDHAVYCELFQMLPDDMRKRFDRTPASLSTAVIYQTNKPIPAKSLDPRSYFNIADFDVPTELKMVIIALTRGFQGNPTYKGITFGKGGCHYVKPGYHKDIYEFDVASLYPYIISKYKLLKTPEAQERFDKMRELRIEYKKTNPQRAKAYKLVLNTLSGNFRNTYSPAFDVAAGEAMCYIGQLIACELALALEWDDVIEINTDSVFISGTRSLQKARDKIKEMFDKSGIIWEEEYRAQLYFRDVNNYIVYDKDGNVDKGKGSAYSDIKKKRSIIAVYNTLFEMLLRAEGDKHYDFHSSIADAHNWLFKYHKSAASKYASINNEPMRYKNYYFLWTTRDCPNSVPIQFSRDVVNKLTGTQKVRWGVASQDPEDLLVYIAYLDFEQYRYDLDDELYLWNRSDLLWNKDRFKKTSKSKLVRAF